MPNRLGKSGTLFQLILNFAISGPAGDELSGDRPDGEDRALITERLWSCHERLLVFLRYKTNSEELAEDLLSETYLAFLQSNPQAGSFRNDRDLRNYLMTIATNKLRDHYRRAANQPARQLQFRSREDLELWLDQLTDARSDHASALAQADEDALRQRLVAEVLAGLPDHYRSILQLKFTADLANPEIAVRLGLGIKAVESLLVRAKSAFKKDFETLALANEAGAGRIAVRKGRRA